VAACDPANRSSDKAAWALGGSDGRRAAVGSHFCGESDGGGGAIGGAVRAALGWSALDCRFAFRLLKTCYDFGLCLSEFPSLT